MKKSLATTFNFIVGWVTKTKSSFNIFMRKVEAVKSNVVWFHSHLNLVVKLIKQKFDEVQTSQNPVSCRSCDGSKDSQLSVSTWVLFCTCFPEEKNELLFLPIYIYSPELGTLSNIHLGCVCNYAECETTYSEFLPLYIFTKDTFKGQEKSCLISRKLADCKYSQKFGLPL